MNRKIFFPLIFLVSFFLFVCKSSALVPLCIYKEYNNDTSEAKTAYIYLADAFIYANVSQDPNSVYYSMANSFDNAVDSFCTLNGVTEVLCFAASGDADNMVSFNTSQFANQMLNNPGSVTYRFGNGNRTGTVVGSDGQLTDSNIEINWTGDTKQKFTNLGSCPQYFVSDGAALLDSPSLEFRNDVGSAGVNNVTFELKSGMFNSSISEMSSELRSCITDTGRINFYKSLFNPSLYSGNAAEQSKLMGLIQRKYGTVLLPNIRTFYSESGECYSANPDKQSEYNELVTMANNFSSFRAGGLGEQDVNSCDEIINGKFAQHLNSILSFIMYLGPILTIVLSSADYFKAMISSDSDAMKKVNKKTIVRIIAALLLFLIPLIIKVLLGIFGFDSSCSILN